MKKILLFLPVLALFATGFMSCMQPKQWNHEQRETLREALSSYRQMVYLDNLNDEEFMLFSDNVGAALEGSYPVYTTFIEMPGVSDTIEMLVTTTIVEELNADAHNMRHLYPYASLVSQGMLPAGLDHAQQKAFYRCFASKVNAAGWTMGQFFNAIQTDTTTMSQIRQMQTQCANSLFNWVLTEVEVVETN